MPLDIDRLQADFPGIDVYNHPPAGVHDPVIIGSLADRLKITKEKPTGDQHTRYGGPAWLYASLDEAKANLSPREYTLVPRKVSYNWESVRQSGVVTAHSLDEAFAAVTVHRGYPVTIAGETRWPGNEAVFLGGNEDIYAPPDTPDDVIGALVLVDYPSLDSVVYRRVDWADDKKYTRRKTFAWSTETASGTVTARDLDEAFTLTPVGRGRAVKINGQTRYVGGVIAYNAGRESLYFSPGTSQDVIGAAFAKQYGHAPGDTTYYVSSDGVSYTYTVPRERIEYVVDRSKYFYSDKTGADLRYALIEWARHAYQTMPTSVVLFNGVTQQTVSL